MLAELSAKGPGSSGGQGPRARFVLDRSDEHSLLDGAEVVIEIDTGKQRCMGGPSHHQDMALAVGEGTITVTLPDALIEVTRAKFTWLVRVVLPAVECFDVAAWSGESAMEGTTTPWLHRLTLLRLARGLLGARRSGVQANMRALGAAEPWPIVRVQA